jgi:hypothetical protein
MKLAAVALGYVTQCELAKMQVRRTAPSRSVVKSPATPFEIEFGSCNLELMQESKYLGKIVTNDYEELRNTIFLVT